MILKEALIQEGPVALRIGLKAAIGRVVVRKCT